MKNNRLTTVYGGQYGSEGKGQIAAFLFTEALEKHQVLDFVDSPENVFSLRIGGPNAGHTFYHPTGGKIVVQSLPIGAYFGATSIIGAAGLIILDLLKKELVTAEHVLGRKPSIIIDPCTVLISPEHMSKEAALKVSIGSTGEGVGAATAEKVMRNPDITVEANRRLVVDALSTHAYVHIERTPPLLNALASEDAWLLVEGTQGVGLSLHTSGHYPYCTSRECTPMGLYAETGINPKLWNEERIAVVRTFPIRVGGNSGPLANEISWDDLVAETNGYVKSPEITTVTKKPRRIGRIDLEYLMKMSLQTGPDSLAVTFMDYVFPEVNDYASHAPTNNYLQRLAKSTETPVKYVSTGPGKTYRTHVC